MKKYLVLCLPLLAALGSGCPRNQYLVELTPHGDALDRQLTFYRADGTDTNGIPNYRAFPEDQLAAITRLYPPGSVQANGDKHFAQAKFTNAMPKDIGGAGSWTNLTTTMGNAALYAERFRGNDDFATNSGKRLAAADRLTDFLLGWSRMELGNETHYEALHRFLDVDFRRDLKNLSLYNWAREISANFNAQADEEFVVRFGLYLNERGYLTMGQLPELFTLFTQENYPALMKLIQRFVAEKLGLTETEPIPKSLAFLADENAARASLEKFLVTTEDYRARLRRWEGEKKGNLGADKPEPTESISDLLGAALEFGIFRATIISPSSYRFLLPRFIPMANGMQSADKSFGKRTWTKRTKLRGYPRFAMPVGARPTNPSEWSILGRPSSLAKTSCSIAFGGRVEMRSRAENGICCWPA